MKKHKLKQKMIMIYYKISPRMIMTILLKNQKIITKSSKKRQKLILKQPKIRLSRWIKCLSFTIAELYLQISWSGTEGIRYFFTYLGNPMASLVHNRRTALKKLPCQVITYLSLIFKLSIAGLVHLSDAKLFASS